MLVGMTAHTALFCVKYVVGFVVHRLCEAFVGMVGAFVNTIRPEHFLEAC